MESKQHFKHNKTAAAAAAEKVAWKSLKSWENHSKKWHLHEYAYSATQ